jgi:hypothetical protein
MALFTALSSHFDSGASGVEGQSISPGAAFFASDNSDHLNLANKQGLLQKADFT